MNLRRLKRLAKRILPEPAIQALRDLAGQEGADHAPTAYRSLPPELVARAVAADGDFRRILPTSPRETRQACAKGPRIGVCGNVANNGYRLVRFLRRFGYEAELVIEDGSIDEFIFNRPFWEDLSVEAASFEEARAWEKEWSQPDFVRRVSWTPELLTELGEPASAIPRVRKAYRQAFGLELPADRAYLLAHEWAHWPLLQALSRYDSVQLSMGALVLGVFCPRPFVVCPVGGDLYLSPFEETVFGLLIRAAYRNASEIIVPEVDYGEYLTRLGVRRPHLLPLAMDTETYRPAPDEAVRRGWRDRLQADVILFMTCRQSWEWKGSDLVFRAFREVLREAPRLGIVATSWGDDLERSKALVRELGIEAKVLWTPIASKPVLRKLLSSADLAVDQVVMPGYGTAVTEAMACERPVLLWDDGVAYREAFDPPPPFLGATSEAGILARLREVAAGRHDLAALGRRSRSWVERFHGSKELAESIVAVHNAAAFPVPAATRGAHGTSSATGPQREVGGPT